MEEKDYLIMCSACKRVKVGEDLWLDQKTDSILYDSLTERYKGRISHGFCPEDAQKILKDLNNL